MSNFCDPRDFGPTGSSVHGILQAIILEWVAILFSRGSSWPRNQTWVSCTEGRFLPSEPPRKPQVLVSYLFYAWASLVTQMVTNLQSQSPILSPIFPSFITTGLFSIFVTLCFVNKFIICTIFFLDSTYKWSHIIFVFVWLTSFSMTTSRQSLPLLLQMTYFIHFFYLLFQHLAESLTEFPSQKNEVIMFFVLLFYHVLDHNIVIFKTIKRRRRI